MAVPNKSFQPKPGGFKKPEYRWWGLTKVVLTGDDSAPRKEAGNIELIILSERAAAG